MKKQKQLNVILMLILLLHFISFAQNPGDFGGTGTAAPTDAPINSNLWVLITIGLGFAFYKTRSTFQKK